MQMAIGFIIGYVVIATVLVPLFFRAGSVSIYGYLNKRFGRDVYHTGAWLFFFSKLLGGTVRLFIACFVLQLLAFEPLGIPFFVNAALTVVAVLVCTHRGGVKSVIWTDVLKTLSLVLSILLCTAVVCHTLDWGFGEMVRTVKESDMSKWLFVENINERRHLLKQLFAGIFTVIAITGLDQDMMQRSLACPTKGVAQRNLIISILLQTVIIFILLLLGVVLYTFAEEVGISIPKGSDNMFPMVATSAQMPLIVGILFVVGLVASTYTSAGSAMTALTTSFTIDILNGDSKTAKELTSIRKRVHATIAVAMFALLCILQHMGSSSVIDAVFTLASYTYGPILGIFAFGILTPWSIRGRYMGIVAVAAPLLSLTLQLNSERWFDGYQFGYELLLVNAALTFIGMALLIRGKRVTARGI